MKQAKLLFLSFLIAGQFSYSATTEWAKSFGGLDDELSYATAIDANGNIFVLTKFFDVCDFDPNPYKTTNATPNNITYPSVAISKYDANGVFLWVKPFSVAATSTGTIYSNTMLVDKTGNVYFGGVFTGTIDFNPDPLAEANLTPQAITTYQSSEDGFVCKLDNNGNFVWVKQFNGDLNQNVLTISVDESSNLFISSISSGSTGIQADFNPDPVATNILTNTSDESQFVTKLDAAGNFVWAKQLQGINDKYCYGIKTDKDGNIYLGGHFMGLIYPDPNTQNNPLYAVGLHDIFLIKWDAVGNYVWSKSFGASSYDLFGSMELDAVTNKVYISGEFSGTVDFNANNLNKKTLSALGSIDGFLAKYDSDGNCEWAKKFGAAGGTNVASISLDALGNVFIGGQFGQTANFDAGARNLTFTSAGNNDAFICKLDNLGNLKWAKQIGGMGNDWNGGVAATGDGNVFVTGSFTFDANIGFTGDPLTAVGGYDIWMFKSNLTTDTKDTQLNANISIYPNPSHGEIWIDLHQSFSHLSVIVRNILGSVVSISSYQDVSKINLNLHGECGLYFVELHDNDGNINTLKLLKNE